MFNRARAVVPRVRSLSGGQHSSKSPSEAAAAAETASEGAVLLRRAVGILDKDLQQATLLRHPQLYRELAWGNSYFSSKHFALDIFLAVVHSAVGFFLIFMTYSSNSVEVPNDGGMWAMGTAVAAFVVGSLCVHHAQRITTWTW